jgi:transcriptional regulator with XRE-family HTH domain
LRAQWLGQQLRERREANGLTLKDTAEYLQRDASTISRFESGVYPIRRGDLLALLDFYRIHEERERAQLFRLSEDVWQTGWWDHYAKDVDRAFIEMPWLEARAERICSYNSMVIPGLMQTRAYAETLIRAAEGSATEDQITRWVELRMTRQQVLNGDGGERQTKAGPAKTTAIIEEWVLRRPIGGAAVMREQLQRLAELGSRPTIEVRVLPVGIGPHAGHEGSFIVFEMPEPYPDIAYVATLAGALYVETPGVDRFAQAYDRLQGVTLEPEPSVRAILAIAEEFG